MRFLHYSDTELPTYPIVFLVPVIRRDEILNEYIAPFGLPKNDVLLMDLHYSQLKKKTPMAEMRQYLEEEIVPILKEAGTKIVVVTDSEYFKALTKASKAEVNLGYAMESTYGDFKVFYVPNYKAKFYDPVKVGAKINQSMAAVVGYHFGNYEAPGADVIHYEAYPTTDAEIEMWLVKLLEMGCPLTVDIEAFDLKHHKSGIATICFCWNEHEGISFPVDYVEIPGATEAPFGKEVRNETRRAMLRWFFEEMKQKVIYHNIAFDAYALVYQLYMTDILDTEGMLEGLGVMLKSWECTKLITYLATNSCAGNKLGLKEQAQSFAGNYAMEDGDIKDVTRIPLPKLLTYNLVDGLSTWHVHDKHYNKMVGDLQLNVYETLFKPSTVDIVQMQLTGMPVFMPRVVEVKAILKADEKAALDGIQQSPIVQQYTHRMHEKWVVAKNASLKVKRVTIADSKEVFNPNSDQQLQDLLFNVLGLPIIAVTKSKQPSTSGDTLKSLKCHTQDAQILQLLDFINDFKAVDKMLTSFIPALENAAPGRDGWHYLFGNYNLGGTVSGRLSSSKPNMQNLPANSKYAKLIKSCFQAPPGWLLIGLDFASLEDRISALTTKDPNKLKVYTDGYDGHCLRAFAYFGDQMTGIVDTVVSINTIAAKYKDLRGDSKAPTFALTYQGTYRTLMTKCGFSEEKARLVESRYHIMYEVSDKWVSDKLDLACKDGYITAAFGLRVRTPLLAQVIRGNSKTPREAEAEGRTAGNALGQSWCLLNSRAGNEFNSKVRKSQYAEDIRPCAQIHDAQYFLARDDMDVIRYVNEHLVKAVQWQEAPEIAHDDVKLGGNLSLFWPDWSKEVDFSNGATEEEIREAVQDHIDWLAAGCPKR